MSHWLTGQAFNWHHAYTNDIIVGDFTGNGASDVLFVGNSNADLYEFGPNSQYIFYPNEIGSITFPEHDKTSAAAGDINGDGLTDVVVTNGNDYVYRMYTSRGDGSFEYSEYEIQEIEDDIQNLFEGYVDLTIGNSNHIDLALIDVDDNGRSDIVHGVIQGGFTWLNGEPNLHHDDLWYVTYNHPEGFEHDNITDLVSSDPGVFTLAGAGNLIDDGGRELVIVPAQKSTGGGYLSPTVTDYIQILNLDTDLDNGSMKELRDGMGYTTSISYDQPLKFELVDDFEFPLESLIPSGPIVSSTHSNTITEGDNTDVTFFTLGNAVFDRQEKRVVGFESMTYEYALTGFKTETTFEFDELGNVDFVQNTAYGPNPIDTDDWMSRSQTFFTHLALDALPNPEPCSLCADSFDPPRRILSQKNSSYEYNKVKGTKGHEVNIYDEDGNLETHKKFQGKIDYQGNDALLCQIRTFSYSNPGAWWIPYKPESIETTTTRRNENPFTDKSTFVYNPDGTLQFKRDIVQNQADEGITTTYTGYDAFGNPGTATISADDNELNEFETQYTYDPTHRFVESTTDQLDRTSENHYHPVWESVVLEKDHLENSIEYEYDGMGRLNLARDAHGKEIHSSTEFISVEPSFAGDDVLDDSDIMFKVSTWGDGVPSTVQFMNRFGMTRSAESEDLHGNLVRQYTRFDDLGHQIEATKPMFANATQYNSTKQQFDDPLYRLTSQKVVDQNDVELTDQTTYSYALEEDGYRTSVTLPNGATRTRLSDWDGTTKESTDAGGTVSHSYFSHGGRKTTELNGTTMVELTYDNHGRRVSLMDANAGETRYLYDDYGRITHQVDPRGYAHVMTYDDYGRIEQQDVYDNSSIELESGTFSPGTGQGSYISTYYENGTGLGQPLRMTAPSGYYREYEYDERGRTFKVIENIEGIDYTFTSTYDDYGRIASVEYPIGTTVDHSYNSRGGLYRMSDDMGAVLWESLETDARGEHTSFLRNGLINTADFDVLGYPLEKSVADNLLYEVTFNWNTGNVTSRHNSSESQNEYFNYDPLDRLVKQVAGWDLEEPNFGLMECLVEYDEGCESAAGPGNITFKQDVGDYSYESYRIPGDFTTLRPNAVSSVSDPHGVISSLNQDITYNAFNSISTIIEGDMNYSVSYGYDKQRKMSVYTDNEIERTRFYIGSYERQVQTENGGASSETEVQYISAPTGMVAILVKEDDGAIERFFPFTDHLGSIIAILDDQGDIVEGSEMSYDAWGRYRSTTDWSQNLTTSPRVDGTAPKWMWRGYTGHEHLDEFGLINMNGRCYDPALGRMLSPDNYVQSPENSQSYNRYSYAMNNPLKYTDPSGETWGAVAGALALGYAGGVIANEGELNPSNWDNDPATYIGVGLGLVGGFVLGDWMEYKFTNTGTVNSPLFGKKTNGLKHGNGLFVSHGEIPAFDVPTVSGKLKRPSSGDFKVRLLNNGRAVLLGMPDFEKLYFDGKYLYWVIVNTNGTESLSDFWEATSGNARSRNTPEGNWYAFNARTPRSNLSGFYIDGFGFTLDVDDTRGPGNDRIPDPRDRRGYRESIRIHPDGDGHDVTTIGTAGCIGLSCPTSDGRLEAFYNRALRYLSRKDFIRLTVNYSW